MKLQHAMLLGLAGGAILVAGCAANVDDSAVVPAVDVDRQADDALAVPSDELVDKAAAWREIAFNAGVPANWNSPIPSVSLGRSVASDLCLLSEVTGDYGDQGCSEVTSYDGMWRGTCRGRAICVNWSSFSEGVNGTHLLLEGSVVASYGGGTGAPPTSITNNANMWSGNSITFVNGMLGEMEGGGEYGRIIQSGSVTTTSKVQVHTQAFGYLNPTYLSVAAVSVFAGVLSQNRLARVVGYGVSPPYLSNGAYGAFIYGGVNTTGTFEFDVATDSGYSSYWLVPPVFGVCGLTRVSGNFNGGGEKATITETLHSNGRNYWLLKTTAGSGASAKASARCMAFNQL